MKYCCQTFEQQINFQCEDHGEDCPEILIKRYSKGYGFPVKDGGESFMNCRYCPWCGHRLEVQ